MITVKVRDYTDCPGPRMAVTGPGSGEEFREKFLLKALRENPDDTIVVDLDGTAGYGSSFLEESFGGLIRAGISLERVNSICKNLISQEDPSLIDEINEYVNEALETQKAQNNNGH